MDQTHKKKIGVLVLICAALCLGIMGMISPYTSAQAEPTDDPLADQRVLDIKFSVKPGDLVAPGEATMTFIISNNSDYDIQNVYLSSSDGLLSEPIGQIDAQETQTLVRPHSVTQEELDAGFVSYVISHDPVLEAAEKVSYSVDVPIIKIDANPSVDFTRQISSEYVAQGGMVAVTYKIRNTGNVPISAIRIKDSLGDFTGRMEQLEVGDTKIFISRVTINAEVASVPELEYADPSGKKTTRELDKASIYLAESALDVVFSVGKSIFDENTADAILTLTNTGNSGYRDITILDDINGGVIGDSISLPQGSEPVEVAYTYSIRGEASYRWRITGVSEAGEEVDFVTETMTLHLENVSADITVSVEAVPRMTKINRPGYVSFDIIIQNMGTTMAQDARLYEVTRGDVRNLAVLPTGEPTQCIASYEVRKDSQFIFCLNYTDEKGYPRTVSTAPINVEITPGGETPENPEEDALVPKGDSVKMSASSAFLILSIGILMVLALLIVVLLITSRRARREKRERIAAQKQRLKEEMGKTNRFTPIKYTGKKKK